MEYIVGVLVALIVEGVKRFVKDDPFTTHVVLFSVAIIGSSLFVWASAQEFWPIVLKILITAAGFHNLVIRKFYGTDQSEFDRVEE
jgi:hypothetical protein